MSTAVHGGGRVPSTALLHDSIPDEGGERRQRFARRLRAQRVTSRLIDELDERDVTAAADLPSDDGWAAGLREALAGIVDDDHVVLSIGGRDRRLRIV